MHAGQLGFSALLFPALLVGALATPLAAQQPVVTVDGDDITITGCVAPVTGAAVQRPETFVWTRGDMMLAGATAAAAQPNPIGTAGIAGRVFYWLDGDEDLAQHVGQQVEVKGELDDFEEGEFEINRDGDFTEIELDLDGREEKARIPTAWLGNGVPDDTEFKVVARKIEVEEVRVIGACTR